MFKTMMKVIDKGQNPHGVPLILSVVIIGLVMMLVWSLVYTTGGTMYVFLHLMYIPILISAFLFHVTGGIVAGVLAGILLGPFMPLNVEQGVEQSLYPILYRTFFFALVGATVGKMASTLRRRSIKIEESFKDISILYTSTLDNFVRLISLRDNQTSYHCERVAYNAWLLGNHSGLNQEELDELYWSGLLHDLGKIGVPESILLKPGKLTDDEYNQMKTHTIIGHEVLLKISPYFERIASGVRSHHEKWNGKGYPDGKSGTSIPLFGRIIAIVDVFEALTSSRPYKDPLSPESALKVMQDSSVQDFDPELFDTFVHLYHQNRIWIAHRPYIADPHFHGSYISRQ